jgi:hypothetical protein
MYVIMKWRMLMQFFAADPDFNAFSTFRTVRGVVGKWPIGWGISSAKNRTLRGMPTT